MADPIREALERLVRDIEYLADHSSGVVELHQNGDLAPWAELLKQGAYSCWLGDALAEARAALAQPEPEVVGPTDGSGKEWQWYTYCPEEGIELYPNRQQAQSAAQSIMGSYEVAAHSDGWHEDMELVSWGMLVPVEQAQVVARGPADPDGEFDEWVRYELRALARWGRPATPAAGEVGELVAWLGVVSEQFRLAELDDEATQTDRAAALLEQFSASQAQQPVPVSERLPGAEDCDAEGRCWLLTVEQEYPQWWLHSVEGHQPGGRMIWVPVDRTPGVMVDAFYVSHWLPAHALPIPATTPAGQEGV